MSEDNKQDQIAPQPPISNSNEGEDGEEGKTARNWWIETVSVLAVGYLIFSLISPMFLKQEQQPSRKIETPDLILITLVLLFNSGLLNRLEGFGISKDGSVTTTFTKLEKEVNKQKKQIDELQAKQLELQSKQLVQRG